MQSGHFEVAVAGKSLRSWLFEGSKDTGTGYVKQ